MDQSSMIIRLKIIYDKYVRTEFEDFYWSVDDTHFSYNKLLIALEHYHDYKKKIKLDRLIELCYDDPQKEKEGMKVFYITKNSRESAYSGPTWHNAGETPRWFKTLTEAKEIAHKMADFNPIGFGVRELSNDYIPLEYPMVKSIKK